MVRVQWSTNSRHPRVRYLPRSVAMTGASRSGHRGVKPGSPARADKSNQGHHGQVIVESGRLAALGQ